MAKGFGIAAVIVVLISFFLPVIGVFTTGLAMVFAAIGALAGDRVWATVTALIAAVSIFFFSPTVWVLLAAPDDGSGNKTTVTVVIIAFLALPFLAMIFSASRGSSDQASTER